MAAKLITICLYAFAVYLRHVVVGRVVECLDDVQLNNLRQERSDVEQIDLSCTGLRWCSMPESSREYRVHKPESARMSYYTYKEKQRRTQPPSGRSRRLPKKSRHIGIRMEWSNKVTQMRDITGYTIAIHHTMQGFGFKICFNVAGLNSTNRSSPGETINFVYHYTCEDDLCISLVHNARYHVTMISLPGNSDVDEETAVFDIVKTPSCKHKDMRGTISCRRHGNHRDGGRREGNRRDQAVRTDETTTTTDEIPPNSTTSSFSSSIASGGGIGLTTFSITLGGIAFSIAFIGWITWGLNAKLGGKKRILFLEKISEDLDNPCSYAFQSLIYEIRKYDLADVTYNRWETVKLITDPIMWIKNATAVADVIIALASPQDSTDENIHKLHFNEWVNSLIQNRRDETHDKKVVLVSFHLKKNDSWPDFCKNAKLSKYKLPEELKKLYQTIFTAGPPKCPFNIDEMTTLANEATRS